MSTVEGREDGEEESDNASRTEEEMRSSSQKGR